MRVAPNSFGLHDMVGNVWEWCQDWYSDYSVSAEKNPTGPVNGDAKVIRGGSGYDGPWAQRSAARDRFPVAFKQNNIGFRIAVSIESVDNHTFPSPTFFTKFSPTITPCTAITPSYTPHLEPTVLPSHTPPANPVIGDPAPLYINSINGNSLETNNIWIVNGTFANLNHAFVTVTETVPFRDNGTGFFR